MEQMKQPFRTVAELPLIEVPKKQPFDWAGFAGWLPTIAVVLFFFGVFLFVVAATRFDNRKAEQLNKETAERNHQIDMRNAQHEVNHFGNLNQCNDWKSMDKESCALCLEGSSIQNDKRCADVSRWYIKQ
jgi:hypothetical protein